MEKTFTVHNDFVGSRVDRWFRRNVCEVPQSLIEKHLRKKKLRSIIKNVRVHINLEKMI